MSDLKVSIEDIPSNTSVESLVDEDIRAFDTSFQRLGNEPMTPSEKAIIKTYLAHKLGVGKGVMTMPAEPKAPQASPTR